MCIRSLLLIIIHVITIAVAHAQCSQSACISSHAFTSGGAGQSSVGEAVCVVNWADHEIRIAPGYLATTAVEAIATPCAVSDLSIQPLGSNIVLRWSPVMFDTAGYPVVVARYDVFGQDSLNVGPSLLGSTTNTVFVRGGETVTRFSRFFFVKAIAVQP
jgi:hypothetical protein